jgi:hypothetical protein
LKDQKSKKYNVEEKNLKIKMLSIPNILFFLKELSAFRNNMISYFICLRGGGVGGAIFGLPIDSYSRIQNTAENLTEINKIISSSASLCRN